MKKERKSLRRVKLIVILSVLFLSILGNFVLLKVDNVFSAGGIKIDWEAGAKILRDVKDSQKDTAKKVDKGNENAITLDGLLKSLKKAGSTAFGTAIRTTLKQMAYDTATYLVSGGEGQKPQFFKEGWGEFLPNVMDSAAGTFIDTLGKEGVFENTFNLCEPSSDMKVSIGLGLQKQRRPSAPKCTWTKLKNSWSSDAEKWSAMGDDGFLAIFQDSFNFENDFGAALTVQSSLLDHIQNEKDAAAKNREENEGWIDFRNVKEVRESFPRESKVEAEKMLESWDNAFQFTGDALVDAANVFVNQLAYELMLKMMRKMADDVEKATSPGSDPTWLSSDSSPYNSGVSGAKEQFRRILEPNFNERGDYDILAELTLCPNPVKAGPTNCVITSDFQQAVTDMMTVGEAVRAGYLNGNGIFGFSSNGLEPRYQEGYPYRSMLILRKFRILPVGWEVAAQYAKDNMDSFGGAKNLQDMLACFESGDEDGFGTFFDAGCVGLVDPNWVLKAPQNYCKREGPGPEILSEVVTGKGEDSELSISRNETYCADEQACIQEDENGICRSYGYCTEEKRAWRFDADSCEPIYNSCEAFSGVDGQSVAYLKNTLDYGGCSIDSAGCTDYCEEYDFDNDEYNCTALNGDKLYLNGKIEECESDEEGCHEFIRFKPGLGANYLQNSSFEDMAGTVDDTMDDDFVKWGTIGEAVSEPYHGRYGLQLNSIFSTTTVVGPETFSVAGKSYVFSFYAKDCIVGDFVELGNASTTLQSGGDWRFYQINYNYPVSAFQNVVTFTINTNDCIIDALKLESGISATVYSDYRGDGLVYQKLAPDYLSCDGVTDPYECNDYVRRCTESELDCGLYTAVEDGIQIPGKVLNENYCPSACVGYDDYLQTETNFDSGRLAYIIPGLEETCSAEVVGCDEFTNLDELGQGAEVREFYSEIRHCRNPDGECAEFYTWEGSSETGFQLKVFSLEMDDDTDDLLLADPEARYVGDAAVTEYDYSDCNLDIYNLPSTDPGYNLDCREFYNTEGDISYHLYTRTITCSDNCHPYRRTDQNIVKDNLNNDLSLAACNALSPFDSDAINYDGSQCFFCKNGGFWDSGHNACIYMAVPSEGEMCEEANVGCREYSGKIGGNMRIIFNHDFESGDVQSWEGDLGSPSLSTDSLIAGGRSLNIEGGSRTVTLELGTILNKNSSYVVSFLAKGNGGDISSIRIGSSTAEMIEFSITSPSTNLTVDWRFYEFNLVRLNNILLDYEVGGEDKLFIEADVDFLIDNIRLTEIVDRYYLIKQDYWNVPDVCEYDVFGVWRGGEYNLGCEEYVDEDESAHYLKGFSSLCTDSAVGCELVIDTQNYSDSEARTWNEFDASEELVSADQFAYVVYNKKKLCDFEDKGCQRLGDVEHYLDNVFYTDIYLKNNPDIYESTLCEEGQSGCELWYKTNGEISTFKNPDDMVCEYRQEADEGDNSWDWFMRRMYLCDADENGEIDILGETEFCSVERGCGVGECILDTNDVLCPQVDKTFGFGGSGNQTTQPYISVIAGITYPWAGACPVNQSSCTEYIDPISTYSSNEIFNPDCINLDGAGNDCNDGWEWQTAGSNFTQEIYLKPFTLYTLTLNGNAGEIMITRSDGANMQPLLSNNTMGSQAALRLSDNDSVIFYGIGGNHIITREDNSDEIILKKTIVSYRKEAVQENECNGNIGYSNGCILFNKREVLGGGSSAVSYRESTWDVDLTLGSFPNLVPLEFSPEVDGWENDSNVLLKVRPDRLCVEWLACRSFIKNNAGQNVCYDIGLCDGMDENGICESFVNEGVIQSQEVGSNYSQYSGVTGYSKVGKIDVVDDDMAGMYTFSGMEQAGPTALVPNGSFEIVGDNNYPLGWVTMDNIGNIVEWEKSGIKIVDNPVSAREEGIKRAPEGRNFLKIGSIYRAASENIGAINNSEYFISAKINTLKLSRGTAYLRVRGSIGGLISLESGNDWTTVMLRFTTVLDLISIDLYAEAGVGEPVGNVYYDDIKIEPVLETRTGTFEPKSCRLYPRTESLSCEETTDSGVREKGWRGYCLEYDRSPGNEDACLMWWPVDRVKGEASYEGGGYIGQYPLYYCQDAVTNRPVERRRIRNPGGQTVWGACNGGCRSYSYTCPTGYTRRVQLLSAGTCPDDAKWFPEIIGWDEDEPGVNSECSTWCDATGRQWFVEDGGDYAWYDYTGDIAASEVVDSDRSAIVIAAESGVKFFSSMSGEITDNIAECQQLTQVVTPGGQNKFWSGRVYEGSNYNVRQLGYEYLALNTPFGSMKPPEPLSNPFEWSETTSEPIPVLLSETVDSQANAGSPYSLTGGTSYPGSQFGICSTSRRVCLTPVSADSVYSCKNGDSCVTPFSTRVADTARENISRIFAKNYGTWVWDRSVSRYTLSDSIAIIEGNCSGDGSDCFYEECEGVDCIFAESGSVCEGGTAAGSLCTGNCDADSCITSVVIIDNYECSVSGSSCCDSGVGGQTVVCGGGDECVLKSDGFYRCTSDTIASPEYCNPKSPGIGYTCYGGGLNDRMIVASSSCFDLETCDLTADSITFTNNICDRPSLVDDPVEYCCPGFDGNCAENDVYTCGGITLDSGGDVCFECQGQGRCEIFLTGTSSNVWDPPAAICPDGVRNIDEYCAIRPIVDHITVDGEDTLLDIQEGYKFVNLTFNSDVDENQLPLVMYAIRWGDGSDTILSGAEMLDRPNDDYPHSLYYLYDFWDMKNKLGECADAGIFDCTAPTDTNCCVDDCCVVTPEIRVKDNWDWCNNGLAPNDCTGGTWDTGPTIVVYE